MFLFGLAVAGGVLAYSG